MPSISSSFESLHLAMEDQPEPKPASLSLITPISPALPLTSSPALLSTNGDPELAIAPTSSSLILLPTPASVRLEMDDQPEPKPKRACLSLINPISLSLPFIPSLAPLSTNDASKLISPPTPWSTSLAPSSKSLPLKPMLLTLPPSEILIPKLDLPLHALSPPPDHFPAFLPLPSTFEILFRSLSVLLMLDSLSVPLQHDQSSSSSEILSQSYRPLKLQVEPTPAPALAVSNVSLSSPERPPSPLDDIVLPLLPVLPLKASIIIPIPPHATPPQRLPGLTTVGSDSSPLKVTPALASTTIPSTPQQVPTLAPQWLLYLISQLVGLQELPTAHEVSSTPLAPHIPHVSPLLLLPGSSPTHFSFALTLITTAALVSALLNFLTTISTHVSKFWTKNEDIGSNHNSTPKASDAFAQQLWLGQYTPNASRFIFDPGGLILAHEDASKCKLKTHSPFITTHDVTSPTLVLADNLVVFNAETPIFF